MVSLLVSGCVKEIPASPKTSICDGLKPSVNKHAEALVKDGGPESLVTGASLISAYDAGCS